MSFHWRYHRVSAGALSVLECTYAAVDVVPDLSGAGVESPIAAVQYAAPPVRGERWATYSCMPKAATKTVPSRVTLLRMKVLQSRVSQAATQDATGAACL